MQLLIAYEILFGVSSAQLFPRKMLDVEESLKARAAIRVQALESMEQTPSVTHRIQCLQNIELGTMPNIDLYDKHKSRGSQTRFSDISRE